MKIGWKNRNLVFTAALCSIVVLLSFFIFQGCSQDDDLMGQEEMKAEQSLLSDSKAYFEELVVANMENTALDLDNTLYPGEFTPLWEDAYADSNDKYEYINVPIQSKYHFVARKDLSTVKASKIRHVVAEQVISFRKARSTGEISAMYMTFVPTPWYFDRHKGNVAASFFSKGNYGDFSGYILYSSPVNFGLQIIVKFEDGEISYKTYRNSSESEDSFSEAVSKIVGKDVLSKKSKFVTKSTEEDDEIIDGGELGEVEVVGDAPDDPNDGSEDDPWGSGDTGNGSSGGGGGGSGSSSTSTGNQKTSDAIISTASSIVSFIKRNYGLTKSVCNIGVRDAFNELYNTNELNGMKANAIVSHMENSSKWESVSMSEAQKLANDGWFVVGGWKNPDPDKSGHVVVIVPGTDAYSPSWGCNVPMAMDTGYNMRSNSQPLNYSYGKNKKDDIKFFKYK